MNELDKLMIMALERWGAGAIWCISYAYNTYELWFVDGTSIDITNWITESEEQS